MFNVNNAQQYTLSIRVSADGFCFAAHHPQRPEEYAFQPYASDPLLPALANLKQAWETLPMLRQSYANVQMLLADAPCEVLPAELCGEWSGGSGEGLAVSVVSGRTALTLRFVPDRALLAWAEETFPGVRIMPGLYPVLRFALGQGLTQTLCHLRGRSMDIISMRDGRLQFVNTFDCDTATTALYYLMGTWQTLGLSQTDDVLTLVGRSACERELKAKLSRFIRHIDEPRSADLFHTTELARLAAVPFDLQALVACGTIED